MASARQPGGLTAAELALACAELHEKLAGARVRDAVRLREDEDLLLFLEKDARVHALWVVPGGVRGRLCTTVRRFPKEAFATGPAAEQCRRLLAGAVLESVAPVPGERRAELRFQVGEVGERRLFVELFGPRGLWCLSDGEGRILHLSRPSTGGRRELRVGVAYAPPPPLASRSEPPPRFHRPCLEAIDRHYRERDDRASFERRRSRLRRALATARARAQRRLDELAEQRRNLDRAGALRRRADLLLSHGHLARPGQRRLRVPDPDREGEEVELELAPDRPFHVQAKELYQRARKLEASREVLAEREAAAARELEEIAEASAVLEASPEHFETLEHLRARAVARGWLREPAPPAARSRPGKGGADTRAVYRSFVSGEGLPILVGRSRADNETLTLRVARGNDLWLHVGGGLAGSHVVVRLPRGRTASLETLLDAATLAVHFSKARGRPECEVLYTRAKHVRKRKGQPRGMVTVTQEKVLRVRHDPQRLRRLLDTASG